MKDNPNKLQSGQLYSLSSILNGDNDKVVIPDLQRDYCWGNSDNDLVRKFLESLYELEWDKEITLGLIYGYTNKELSPNHIQLCDGQQRITTLFLLIGTLNKRLNNKYRSFLISNWEEQNDDKEPYLQYAIRESSLYFLSDLTYNYFLSDSNIEPAQIRRQPWFLQSYSLDPTIDSILSALSTMDDWLSSNFQNSEQLEQFCEFILHRIKFLYHDMENRENGEETFVVINTTGEPLSTIQNLKPRIIEANSDYGNSCIARKWETMETWFWQNRHKNDKDTADEGMLAFLHCVRILQTESEQDWYNLMETDDDFPISISMDTIWKWFEIYKMIYKIDYSRLHDNNISYPDNQCHFLQKQLFSILPTMSYANAHHDASIQDIRRVYHLFSNMSRYRTNTRSSQNEALNVPAYRNCQLIKLLKNNDILELIDLPDFDIEEELAKLRYIASHKESRECIEEIFSKAENFNIFDGKISILLSWSKESQEHLEYLCNKIESLWITNKDINYLRRALLAFDSNQSFYPMPTSSANYTLCDKTEWRDLFEKNSELMYNFIDEDHDQLILNYQNTNSEFYPVIKDGSLIEFALDHNVRQYKRGSQVVLVELLKKERESSDFLLLHQGCEFPKSLLGNKWDSLWAWGDGDIVTLYSPCKEYNITIDLLLLDNNRYQLIAHIDRAPHKKTVTEEFLKSLGFQYIEGYWRYVDIETITQAKDKLIELTKSKVFQD